ncbi:MAG: ABC transporter substrate-binding protein [Trueperaceae bacterium]
MRRSVIFLALAWLLSTALAQTNVVMFLDPREPMELYQQYADSYNAANPDVTITFESGGATSDQQQQYLNTVLSGQSGDIDIFQIDVIRPATYAAAGWADPLDPYLGDERDAYLSEFLAGPVNADTVNGTLYAVPAYTDAMFLYYRADLLEKYGFEPPATLEELERQALAIMEGENDPNLQGYNYQGAAIEGAVCTFLQPFWSAGGDWLDDAGNVNVESDAGRRALEWYQRTLDSGITKPNIAETATDNSRQEFQAGHVVFMVNWGYAWAHFQNDEDSTVRGNVGVAPIPAFEGGESYTCVGGWQWALNPYGTNKDVAFDVIRHYSSPEFQRDLAIVGGRMPARSALYQDAAVLEANPHFGAFYDVILAARPRPVTEFYTDVSEIIRSNMNAFLAGTQGIDDTLAEMQIGLEDAIE